MDQKSLVQSIESYKSQLLQVEAALSVAEEGPNKQDLISLRNDIINFIELAQENWTHNKPETQHVDDEYSLFIAEMEKEGAVAPKKPEVTVNDLQSIEGLKCRAPHTHKWGDTMYHNAIVCSTIPSAIKQSFNEIQVKVMFINPTHQEMLPCPFIMDSECKFTDEQCKYSHGEIVLFSSLQEYSEPNFEAVTLGSCVLAKQSDHLWSRAVVTQLFGVKCRVKFDNSQSEVDLKLEDILPLNDVNLDGIHLENNDIPLENDSDSEQEDVINMSLMSIPASQALGDWEKHTKGIGSKIMQHMGYVTGTGLGRLSDGRLEPVPAVVLPPGKSLDHCMNLRENAGGEKDLFSVERKLKKLQKKQELQNQKAYEREKNKVNVFNLLNETLLNCKDSPNLNVVKNKHRQDVKKESSRNLNVASMQIDENIKRIQLEILQIKESLRRQSDIHSQVHKTLKQKLISKQNELQTLKDKAVNILHEQNIRMNKKKLTVF